MSPIESIADLDRLTDDLEIVADWRDELRCRIRRAQFRFEYVGLAIEEQDSLAAEVEAFKQVCRALTEKRVTNDARVESEAGA